MELPQPIANSYIVSAQFVHIYTSLAHLTRVVPLAKCIRLLNNRTEQEEQKQPLRIYTAYIQPYPYIDLCAINDTQMNLKSISTIHKSDKNYLQDLFWANSHIIYKDNKSNERIRLQIPYKYFSRGFRTPL